jgi:hypothetical protein
MWRFRKNEGVPASDSWQCLQNLALAQRSAGGAGMKLAPPVHRIGGLLQLLGAGEADQGAVDDGEQSTLQR